MHPHPVHIAVCFSGPTGYGGAAGVLAWSLHALQDVSTLSVYSMESCKYDNWNSAYGTRLQAERIDWHSFEKAHPLIYKCLVRLDMSTLNQYVLMKWAGTGMGDDDLAFSVHNEMAFPSTGLQYIHFPMLMTGRRGLSKQIGQPGTLAKDLFGTLCRWLFRVRKQDLSRNRSLCNSAYIEAIYKEYYGGDTSTRVLYPPCAVAETSTSVPWPVREDAIVVMGRAVPHKRLQDAIAIRRQCEQEGLVLILHIVTPGGDPDYLESLQNETKDEKSVVWHFNLERTALQALLARCKYGLHCNPGEHFGMATAEMAGSGCLVLGHDSGGTREILPSDQLRFNTPDEAVSRLLDLHQNPDLRSEMLSTLAAQSQKFTSDTFCRALCEEIRSFQNHPHSK